MRRRPESANGVMAFLIAETAMRLQTDGVPVMSLSGTPLAHAKSSGRIDRRDSVLERLSSSLEPVYGFRSLLRFKSKFQPEFLPLIMGFPDAAALPRIGIALARAYLPELSVARARVLIRFLG
jgi:phosphatidylglycerol lysyltransferase